MKTRILFMTVSAVSLAASYASTYDITSHQEFVTKAVDGVCASGAQEFLCAELRANADQVGQGLPDAIPSQDPACSRDLSNGVVVAFSGGPLGVLKINQLAARFDEYIMAINTDALVNKCSGGTGLAYKLLKNQKTPHIHQSKWRSVCKAIKKRAAGPIIIAGYSMGGAAAVSLARCLNESGKAVDLLVTLDTVATGLDMGDVYSVPPNVKLNINGFQKPTLLTFVPPFPFGLANKREDGGKPENIFNAGMRYDQPSFTAHLRLIYDFCGGKKSEDSDYSTPFVLDVTLAVLTGATNDDLQRQVIDGLERLAAVRKIKIFLSGAVNRNIPEKSCCDSDNSKSPVVFRQSSHLPQ